MRILDLKTKYKKLYLPSAKKVEALQVPRLQYLMLDGATEKGSSPGTSPAFQDATQAMYGLSYTLKFSLKKRKTNPIDYPVMALEGLWWISNGEFDITKPDNWLFTLMIMQPEVVTQELLEVARETVRKKRGGSPALDKTRLEAFEEGLAMQVMHIGPYATEPATIERMKAFAAQNGYRDCVGLGGKHHEIYLGDPRKAKPDKLKTVLRHPIEKL